MASDPLTTFQEGLVSTVDTVAAVRAITQRASQNIMPWNANIASTLPVVTYLVPSCIPRVGGYDVALTLSAWAMEASVAQALLHAVLEALTQPALFAAGCDAVVLTEIRREIPSEGSDEPARADADLTLWYTP